MFSPSEYKKNEKIILKYFQKNLNKLRWWKCIVMFAINIENLKTIKYNLFKKKTLDLSIVYSKCGHEYIKYLKKKIQLKCWNSCFSYWYRRVSETIKPCLKKT